MQVSSQATSRRFLHAFWGLRQTMLRRVNPVVKAQHGLELPDVMLLEHIGTTDLSPSEIAETMQIPAHAVSRRLDGLERGGLIGRSLDPDDARRRVLSLTPAGERVMAAVLTTLHREVQTVLDVLAPEGLEGLLQAIETINRTTTQENQGNQNDQEDA